MLSIRVQLASVPLLLALLVSLTVTHHHANAKNSETPVKETELLEKYIMLCGQAAPDRIESMQTLSPGERSYLWRVHLGLYLARNPTLSRDQQNIVLETLAFVTPELFNPPNPNDPRGRAKILERVNALKQRGLQVFSKDQAAEIFSAIGDAQDGEALRKYTQLSELSKDDRKVSFNFMSAEDKSSLWRVHLGLNLARHPEWTEQQRSIVLETIAMVTPQLYKIPKDTNWTRIVGEPVQLLKQKALLVFTRQEGAALFSELGFGEQPQANHARREARGKCGCAQEDSYCAYQCQSADCTVVIFGCGTVGLYACNGTCYEPPNSGN